MSLVGGRDKRINDRLLTVRRTLGTWWCPRCSAPSRVRSANWIACGRSGKGNLVVHATVEPVIRATLLYRTKSEEIFPWNNRTSHLSRAEAQTISATTPGCSVRCLFRSSMFCVGKMWKISCCECVNIAGLSCGMEQRRILIQRINNIGVHWRCCVLLQYVTKSCYLPLRYYVMTI